MIPCTLDWISRMNKEHGIEPAKVLDVGSYDYNGNPRSLFPDSEYIGIDIKEGPNVDFVSSGVSLDMIVNCPGVLYIPDAVLCLYIFEHIINVMGALEQAYYLLKPGGYFYIAVPTFGYPHHFPPDYWRFSEEAVREFIMEGYTIIDLEHGKSQFGKHPVINCLGVKG